MKHWLKHYNYLSRYAWLSYFWQILIGWRMLKLWGNGAQFGNLWWKQRASKLFFKEIKFNKKMQPISQSSCSMAFKKITHKLLFLNDFLQRRMGLNGAEFRPQICLKKRPTEIDWINSHFNFIVLGILKNQECMYVLVFVLRVYLLFMPLMCVCCSCSLSSFCFPSGSWNPHTGWLV